MVGVGDYFAQLSTYLGDYSLLYILFFFTAVIVVYAVFVYYFYKFLAKKNIIDLNLKQYSKTENPLAIKFFAFIFYILEYIIILPILTFFWFGVLSFFLLVLVKNLELSTILIIAAALIASVRVTAYISEALSKDLAKMLPLTLLALALTSPDFFSIELFFERIMQLPSLIVNLPYYLLFIVAVEFIMRGGSLIRRLFKFQKQVEIEESVSSVKSV